MSVSAEDIEFALFRAHLDRCADAIKAPLRPDVKVTIVVRAPEALPEETMFCTNDNLALVEQAIQHFRNNKND